MCVRVLCVCVCARARARMCVCVWVCALMKTNQTEKQPTPCRVTFCEMPVFPQPFHALLSENTLWISAKFNAIFASVTWRHRFVGQDNFFEPQAWQTCTVFITSRVHTCSQNYGIHIYIIIIIINIEITIAPCYWLHKQPHGALMIKLACKLKRRGIDLGKCTRQKKKATTTKNQIPPKKNITWSAAKWMTRMLVTWD